MVTAKKKIVGQQKSAEGQLAKVMSFSLYPRHRNLVLRREQELNLHRSDFAQVLFEIEERDGLVRRELIARLSKVPPAEGENGQPPKQTTE